MAWIPNAQLHALHFRPYHQSKSFFLTLGKTLAQVEAHERWYQQLQRLRREQRLELDEWRRKRKEEEEKERKKALMDHPSDGMPDPWVSGWRRQRSQVQEQLQKWKEEKMKREAEESSTAGESAEALRKRNEKEQKRKTEAQYQKLLAYLWRMEQEAAKAAVESADQFIARLDRLAVRKRQKSADMLREKRSSHWLNQRQRHHSQQNDKSKVIPKVYKIKLIFDIWIEIIFL